MNKLKLGAIALALSFATALPVEVPYSGGLLGAPAAQAGVWDSIKSGVKKVGGAIDRATKLGEPRRYSSFGFLVTEVSKTIGRGMKNVVTAPYRAGKFIATGGFKFRPPGPAPNLNRPLPKPPAGQPGSWGGGAPKSLTAIPNTIARDRSTLARPVGVAAPNTGIAKANLGTATPAIARDRSTLARPVGVAAPNTGIAKANVIRPKGATDRSTLARPVGVKPPKVGMARPKVVRPRIARDRSVMGRPVRVMRAPMVRTTQRMRR
jgi:hypothetical protein